MLAQAAPWLRIARFRPQIDARIASVLSGTSYVLGPEVEQFEESFAAFTGTRHCVGVASGTDALALALRAMGIGSGDEVITASMTASATGAAILHTGATLRLIDIDPATRVLDVSQVGVALTSATAAIVPVHLHGHAVDMPALMEIANRHGLAVIEDCAQAHGATWDGRPAGSFGHMAAFSFYPTKNLGAVGDGGAVVTQDARLAERLRSLRAYGWSGTDRVSGEIGWNSRLDELQAAILNVLLPELEQSTAERRVIAATYRHGLATALAGFDFQLPPDVVGCIPWTYRHGRIGWHHVIIPSSSSSGSSG